jgi:hypothetical protein
LYFPAVGNGVFNKIKGFTVTQSSHFCCAHSEVAVLRGSI